VPRSEGDVSDEPKEPETGEDERTGGEDDTAEEPALPVHVAMAAGVEGSLSPAILREVDRIRGRLFRWILLDATLSFLFVTLGVSVPVALVLHGLALEAWMALPAAALVGLVVAFFEVRRRR